MPRVSRATRPSRRPCWWDMAAGSTNSKRGKGVLSVGEAPDRVVKSMLNDALYSQLTAYHSLISIRVTIGYDFPLPSISRSNSSG